MENKGEFSSFDELLEELNKIKNTKDIENIEEIIQKAHRIKNSTQELKKENERLSNRFGLVWKNIPEKFVKYVSDTEIVYDRKLYEYMCERKNSNEKSQTLVQFELENEVVKAKKEATSFSFSFKGEEYLTYSNNIYKFRKNVKEDFVPYLKKKGNDFEFGDNKKNLIIEGDNYFALQALLYTHKNKIDMIYIDPPYNTGNEDFKYNDSFIKEENGDKHSSWLSFMFKRLLLSKELLSSSGLIAIQINDKEHANLKLICDSIFNEENRINDISVKMSQLSGVKMSSVSNKFPKIKENILFYAKNKEKLTINIPKIKKDSGIEGYLKYYSKIILNPNDAVENWEIVSLKDYGEKNKIKITKDFKIKNANRIIYRTSNKTLKKYYEKNQEKKISEIVSPTGIKYIQWEGKEMLFLSNYLDEYLSDIWMDIATINLNKENAGLPVFNNGQKPLKLMKRIINLIDNKDIKVLDFFAGSGTTGQAVWELNKEDGGNRQFILCTNNENNICEDITFERLKRANEKYGYNKSLEYLKLQHASISQIKNADKNKNFEFLKELINLKYNSFKTIVDDENFYVNENIAVLKEEGKMEEFFETYKDHKNFAFLSPYKTGGNEKFKKLAKNITGAKEENIILLSDNYIEEIKEIIKEEE